MVSAPDAKAILQLTVNIQVTVLELLKMIYVSCVPDVQCILVHVGIAITAVLPWHLT